VRKCFPFNEFGPSVLNGTSAFLRDPACLPGRAVLRGRCFPDRAIRGGLQGLFPVLKRPRMAVSVSDKRRMAATERFPADRQRSPSACWPLTAIRPLWNRLDQRGLTAATLLGEEPFFGESLVCWHNAGTTLLTRHVGVSRNHSTENPVTEVQLGHRIAAYRHKLAAGEVAGGAEHDQSAGFGGVGKAQALAQQIHNRCQVLGVRC